MSSTAHVSREVKKSNGIVLVRKLDFRTKFSVQVTADFTKESPKPEEVFWEFWIRTVYKIQLSSMNVNSFANGNSSNILLMPLITFGSSHVAISLTFWSFV